MFKGTACAVVLLAGGVGVAGCGGGDDTSQIKQVIGATAELKSTDVCANDFTDHGVEQFFRDTTSPAAARKDCTGAVGKPHLSASDLSYKSVTVTGSKATAVVTYKGRTAHFSLLKQGGWKIDSVTGS